MKKFYILFVCTLFLHTIFAQEPKTVTYVTRESGDLQMDIYTPTDKTQNKGCFIFIHGGGFKNGNRAADATFLKQMAAENFVTVSIDYRLGMKGVTKVGKLDTKPIENAINVAVEDLYSAVNYLVTHASDYGIDKDKIIICGSSAGAITVLQADYYLANRMPLASVLPDEFRFAGVISFAGEIFSHEGAPKWTSKPAPTLMFHGTADKLVAYKQTRLFKKGVFGSSVLAKRFKKFNHPYKIVRYVDIGHEVAGYMSKNVEEIKSFIDDYIVRQKFLQIDATINDPSLPRSKSIKPNDLYKE